MIFVCDRSGPVQPAGDIGLVNNPESEHRLNVIQRQVRLWNLTHPERPLKIFHANDEFPMDRWDAELFELLPVAKSEPVIISEGAGGPDYSGVHSADGSRLLQKVIEIGPWDMSVPNVGAQKNIAHGLGDDYRNIVEVSGYIKIDPEWGPNIYPIAIGSTHNENDTCYIGEINRTYLSARINHNKGLNLTKWNDTSINRGHVVIRYFSSATGPVAPAPAAGGAANLVSIGGVEHEVKRVVVHGQFDDSSRLNIVVPHGIPGNIYTNRKIISAKQIHYNYQPESHGAYGPMAGVWAGYDDNPDAILRPLLPEVFVIDDTSVRIYRSTNYSMHPDSVILIEYLHDSSLTLPAPRIIGASAPPVPF